MKKIITFSILLLVLTLLIILNLNKKVNFLSKAATTAPRYSNSFFPIGIYYLPGPESPTSWQAVKDLGLNTVAGWWTTNDTLTNATKYGIKMIGTLEYAFSGYKNCITPTANDLITLKNLVKSPALIGWYTLDEPNPYKLPCYQFHQWLASNDSNHPIWTDFLDTSSTGEHIFPFKKTVLDQTYSSVVGFDSNVPSFDFSKQEYGSLVNQYVTRVKNGSLGKYLNSFWVVLPAHSEQKLTLASMNYQVYDSIINGAQGIFWWDWPYNCDIKGCGKDYGGGLNGYSAHKDKIKVITGQLNKIMPALSGGITLQTNTNDHNFSYKIIKGTDSKTYVLATNKSTGSNNFINLTLKNLPVNTTFSAINNANIFQTDSLGNLNIINFWPHSVMILVSR